ncbi:MAG TPA: lytic transglycosylase domain-containing protein [Methylomusa anaerophila]|nr:lytic transglycosylase domain-containing protein [Methylomusa anaerophila]HML86984.1 lytic transglycosylase domain-containing protein [Methylomusa anaerophila]
MNSDIASIVHSAALKYGVNPMLALAVAKTESNLAPDAVSPAGAAGVMQLMPETASELGIQNIADPRENIDGGVRYLKQMLNIFNGDVNKAVAAYNAGPQAVKQYGGIPPYRETQEYVARVSMLAK